MNILESMKVLKDFYEKFSVLIEKIGLLSTRCNTKSISWGGHTKGIRYEFKSIDECVSIKLFDVDYKFILDVVCFRELKSTDIDVCTFVTSGISAWIYMGAGFSTIKFNVGTLDGSANTRLMSYPILEEEYFQYNALFELEEEEFYKYFMAIEPPAIKMDLAIIGNDNGIELSNSVLNDSDLVDTIVMQLDILITEYKRF